MDKEWLRTHKEDIDRLAGKAEELDFIINLETYLAVIEKQATATENEGKEEDI